MAEAWNHASESIYFTLGNTHMYISFRLYKTESVCLAVKDTYFELQYNPFRDCWNIQQIQFIKQEGISKG